MLTDVEVEELKEIARKIRVNSIKMVYSAKSGHPGGSLSIADILAVLYFKVLNIDPVKTDDPNRDRFVLSKGHASPGMYATLALRGFFPEAVLPGFRKLTSKLEGHVHKGVPGIESSTGSLGQGLGVGIGMALAARVDHLDYRVYVAIGDGESEEGNIWESLMAGNKFGLSNITVILDRNGVQLDGKTDDIMPMGNVADKVRSFGWNVIEIDGHDMRQIYDALMQSKEEKNKPTFIVANTIKGKGVSYMEGKASYHGRPPADEDEYEQALKELGEEITA